MLARALATMVALGIAAASSTAAAGEPRQAASLVPTLGIGVGVPVDDPPEGWPFETKYLPLWVGTTVYPTPSTFAGFVSVGSQVHLYFARDEASPRGRALTPEFIPTLRGGIAVLVAPDTGLGQLIAAAKVYGLAGYRLPSSWRGGAFQLGVGASSPLFGIAAASASKTAFIPSAIELAVGVTPHGEVDSFDLRYGFEI